MSHTASHHFDSTAISPAVAVVTLTMYNVAGNDNVFSTTTREDDSKPAGQVPYTTNNEVVPAHQSGGEATRGKLRPHQFFQLAERVQFKLDQPIRVIEYEPRVDQNPE